MDQDRVSGRSNNVLEMTIGAPQHDNQAEQSPRAFVITFSIS